MDESFKVVVKVAGEVVKDGYNDALKPIVRPTGELLGLVPRAIKAAFASLEKWTLRREYNVKETELLLAKKLEHIDPEKIVSPEPYIAVPALLQISYSIDNEELRNMYANLLSRAMNIDTKDTVHPAFTDIIKQLSPDEALLLKYIYKDKPTKGHECTIPFVTLIYHNYVNTYNIVINKFSNFPEKAGCTLEPYAKIYFDNLERLGILESVHERIQALNYQELKEHPYIHDQIEELLEDEAFSRGNINFQEGIYQLTVLGIQFCETCVADPEDKE